MDATPGVVVGDRNDWKPILTLELPQLGSALLAPYRWTSQDPHPRPSAFLSRIRYRIDTVFSQLVERSAIKRVWARDPWHLWNRVLRVVLLQTLAVWLNSTLHRPPLHLASLVA